VRNIRTTQKGQQRRCTGKALDCIHDVSSRNLGREAGYPAQCLTRCWLILSSQMSRFYPCWATTTSSQYF